MKSLFWFLVLLVLMTSMCFASLIDEDAIKVVYLFDENNGDIVKDVSGNRMDGMLIGAKHVEGVFGQALEYDGVDDNLIINGYNGVGGTDPRTIIFWFKSFDVRQHSLVKWGVQEVGEKYYIRTHPQGGGCGLRVEVGSGNSYGEDNICDGEWHHLAVVFPKGSSMVGDHNLYVDGKLQGQNGVNRAMNTNVGEQVVNIGGKLTAHRFMFGSLDEFAIFDIDLSEEQINMLRKNGLVDSLSVDLKGKLTVKWAMIKQLVLIR